jgi:hypothetical protein
MGLIGCAVTGCVFFKNLTRINAKTSAKWGFAFSDGNFLNAKRCRKIGKRDTYALPAPE